jgi:pimeloyl-ACP methyl ester carboxylesterase
MIARILFSFLVGYVALCIITFVFQRKMLYLPFGNHLSEGQAIQQGLQHWPSYENYRGYISQSDMVDSVGTVIVFHGNAGAAYHRRFYVDALTKHNLRVILAEYPGYAGREGSPGEDLLVKDALETISLVYQKYGGPIILWGESLGGGVISGAISKTDTPIAGVVMFTPWDSLPSLAQTHYWYLPAKWLVLDRYNSVENLREYKGKVAVLLAGEDEVIPIKHGKRLYESIAAEKKLWTFEGERHNEVSIGAHLQWWQEVVGFLSK